MSQEKALRQQIVDLLTQSGAHTDFAAAVADLPVAARGKTPPNVPHSPWRLVEHMRIAQWDILEFCRNPRHVSPKFPDGYWPAGDAPPSPDAWDKTIAAFQADLAAMCDLVMDPTTDLFARIPHGEGQTILREALLVADHNAYHIGQLIIVRRALGAWPDGK
jgi:hypothetical protein